MKKIFILLLFFSIAIGSFFLLKNCFFPLKKADFSCANPAAVVSSLVLLPFSHPSLKENSQIVLPTPPTESALSQTQNTKIIFMAVGDMMFDRGVKTMVTKYGKADFAFSFAQIKDFLSQADILFGNLEGPISERGKKVGSIYSFRFARAIVETLKTIGFDVLSLANNHMLDYQTIALEDTMNALQNAGIDYVGAGFNTEQAFALKIKEQQGTKIGFLAFENLGPATWQAGEHKTGMAWISAKDFAQIQENISQAKSKVDILIVSLHAGVEYQPMPDAFQKAFAQMAIEKGADIVIGHHPHVVQPLIPYKNGWIAYSLGNFIFDQYFSPQTMQGAILKAEIKNKKIESVMLQKIKLNRYYQPQIAKD